MKSRFEILNLGDAFDRFMSSQYETILGCLCERLADGRYKWREVVGTKSEIEKAIIDAGMNIKNSLKINSMNIELESLRLAHASLSDKVYAGVLTRDKKTWLHKVDVTSDFITAVLARWNNSREVIQDEYGKRYEITVKEIK